MPMSPSTKRMYQKHYMRGYRAKQKAAKEVAVPDAVLQEDPVATLCQWATKCLVVPPGHVLAGQPMTPPLFMENAYRGALDEKTKQFLLCLGART